MSIATTALRYGWRIVAGAVLTGGTIYVASNAPKYIYQRDVVEIVLGVTERCLATQINTNSTYSVSPPSYVRSWVTTNGLSGTNFAWVTNQVTNQLSWFTDRAMMVDLDAKIFALIPYYVDTNSVFDGTTNIVMLTVTNLFATLGIGDHTNQFTQIPCWTNNPGTTNCTTNAATFGPWAWRNYVVAWQERYKVLNALKCVKIASAFDTELSQKQYLSYGEDIFPYRSWDNFTSFNQLLLSITCTNGVTSFAESGAITNESSAVGSVWQTTGQTWAEIGVSAYFVGNISGTNKYIGGAITERLKITGPKVLNTNLQTIKSFCQQYISEGPFTYFVDYGVNIPTATNVFHSYYSGDEIYTNASQRTVKEWPSNHVFLIDYPIPEFQTPCNVQNQRDLYGATYRFVNSESYVFPQFNYCTNSF
jgi:hypothetical protein